MTIVPSIKQYLSGAWTEFRKVSWPTKEQFRRSVVVVIIGIAITTVLVMLLDSLLGQIIKSIVT